MPDENQQPNHPVAQSNPERKTLDDRAKMTELERIRHSAAHVMATAILRIWPDAQFAAGPPVNPNRSRPFAKNPRSPRPIAFSNDHCKPTPPRHL